MKKRGLFFSLDGLDGTGKSTQCRLLVNRLRGADYPVTFCSDPGGTPIGDVLRDLLLDKRRTMTLPCETFLFLASRAQLTAEVIRPALKRGHMVVSDRFILANLVYQGHAGGLDPDLIYRLSLLATDGLEPDFTFVLDLPVKGALKRRQGPGDRVESRNSAYQARVRRGFRAEVRRRSKNALLVDASRSIDEVHAKIWEKVESFLVHPKREPK